MEQQNEQGGFVTIDALDLTTLLYHVHAGAKHPDVGYEDCEHSLREFTKILAPKRIKLPLSVLERALWSANLMDEVGAWQPLRGEESFESFVSRVLSNSPKPLIFNRDYNQIREK